MQILLLSHPSTTALANEKVIQLSIGVRVIQDAFGFFLVATCSPTLLNVAFETFRHGVMDDETYIALVDTHTKGYRGDNYLNLIVHPVALNLLPT